MCKQYKRGSCAPNAAEELAASLCVLGGLQPLLRVGGIVEVDSSNRGTAGSSELSRAATEASAPVSRNNPNRVLGIVVAYEAGDTSATISFEGFHAIAMMSHYQAVAQSSPTSSAFASEELDDDDALAEMLLTSSGGTSSGASATAAGGNDDSSSNSVTRALHTVPIEQLEPVSLAEAYLSVNASMSGATGANKSNHAPPVSLRSSSSDDRGRSSGNGQPLLLPS